MTLEKKHSVIEANNLTIGYQSKKKTTLVAEGINFSIYKGELIGLVGTNGIGKSTLLRTIAGMQPAIDGIIYIDNIPLKKYHSLQLANQLSIVLTEAPASRNLTVLELVSLGRQPYTNWVGKLSEKDKETIHSALQNTETESLAYQKCFEISDGQLQRVMIARALAQDTPLILLDEPTTHLDMYHRAYVLKLLKKLASDSGKTILFSTHEIDLAIQLSDKMMVMTPETIHFNTSKKLIEAGCFESLFPKETIQFNSETGRFSIK